MIQKHDEAEKECAKIQQASNKVKTEIDAVTEEIQKVQFVFVKFTCT